MRVGESENAEDYFKKCDSQWIGKLTLADREMWEWKIRDIFKRCLSLNTQEKDPLQQKNLEI